MRLDGTVIKVEGSNQDEVDHKLAEAITEFLNTRIRVLGTGCNDRFDRIRIFEPVRWGVAKYYESVMILWEV